MDIIEEIFLVSEKKRHLKSLKKQEEYFRNQMICLLQEEGTYGVLPCHLRFYILDEFDLLQKQWREAHKGVWDTEDELKELEKLRKDDEDDQI